VAGASGSTDQGQPIALRGGSAIADEYRVNGKIRARSIRVVDEGGNQLGILELGTALGIAEERGLDLVEVAPNATPPVCRLMNFGKFKYEQKKKNQEAKKKQQAVTIKEIKLRPQTDKHDLETKIRAIRRFLGEGDKVKLNVFFRGREMAHPELGEKMLVRVAESVRDIGVVETPAGMDQRRMVMVLAPAGSAGATPRPAAPAPAPTTKAAPSKTPSATTA
jgi:translation initiation factor IF-3